MWLLPSPARARRACPLPGQGGGNGHGHGDGTKQSQTHLSDSHFISLAASAGCDTIRCHTTAWNASVCGVTVLELTVGTMTHASATLAVNPPSRPTIP